MPMTTPQWLRAGKLRLRCLARSQAPLRGITQLATWIEEALRVLEPDTRQKMALFTRSGATPGGPSEYPHWYSVWGGVPRWCCVDTRALVADIVTMLSPPEAFIFTVRRHPPRLRHCRRAPLAGLHEPHWQRHQHHDQWWTDRGVAVRARASGMNSGWRTTDRASRRRFTRRFSRCSNPQAARRGRRERHGTCHAKKSGRGTRRHDSCRVPCCPAWHDALRFTWRKQWRETRRCQARRCTFCW